MFQKFSNSWKLIKASAAVLRADKELVVFPIVSALGVLIVTATFALPMWLAGTFDAMLNGGEGEGTGPLSFIALLLFYIVQYFVIFFANSALVGATMIRLRGGDPTLGDGFRIATRHLGQILGYALIAATVGMVLRWLSEKAGLLGRIVISIIGLVWNVATYLVVPILVEEDTGPVDAIKRSVELLKKTWGEQIAGSFSMGLVFGLLSFLLIVVMGILIAMAAVSESLGLAIFLGVLLVLALLAIALINATLSGIYTAAVYQYAVTGEISDYFETGLVQGAFHQK
ncbi:MAG: hypothetical protein JXA37_10310 [Chloroflexia bacterium]|nr:hypothetical protein [Chloroflexia bacterium]